MSTSSQATNSSRAWLRFKRNRGALVGLVLVCVVALLALLAPALAPHPPDVPYKSRTLTSRGVPIGPERAFPLGADSLGRCELSRLLYGGRVSLAVALASTLLLAIVGTGIGIASGYFGGLTDTVLMRGVDVLLSFPFLLVCMAINKTVARPGIWVLFLVLGFLSWTGLARQVRARTMQVRSLEFVTAARALGATHSRVIFRHILPNVASLVIVLCTTLVAEMIIVESVLSYLGVGVVPPTSSWGSMLQESDPYMRSVPRLLAIPAMAITVTVVGFNLLGEGLRDALDPKS
ncbi:MAG: ABC transporter permease [Deltaproteobacteria bacterium]|nr:ABC transporter permease [Deltaproteobacteria bacterium]